MPNVYSNTDNSELGTFETQALVFTTLLSYNGGKNLPQHAIFQALRNDEKKYSQRIYGYLPPFLPAHDGKGGYKIRVIDSSESDQKIVKLYIDLDNEAFKRRACDAIEAYYNSADDAADNKAQLDIRQIQVRPVYGLQFTNFACNDYSSPLEITETKNQLHSTAGHTQAIVELKLSKELAEYVQKNATDIVITYRYDVQKVAIDTNSTHHELEYTTRRINAQTQTIIFENYDYTPEPQPKPEAKSPQTITENCGDKNLGLELMLVEGGKFLMGGQDDEVQANEKPVHEVALSTFYMGKYPITQKQWRAIMGDNPSHFGGRDDHPVEMVDWNDANGFCDQLNRYLGYDSDAPTGKFRLPTEAEWEYAARGGRHSQNHKYAGGGGINDVAWCHLNNGNITRPVGKKRGNELGIHDMSGNVWEWCRDWHGAYSAEFQTNPTGPSSGSGRVLRGGAWNFDALSCRVAFRYNFAPAHRCFNIGFRVVFVP